MKLKYGVILMCCISIIISGCAGRAANPVTTYRPNDERASCASLMAEMVEIEGEISKRLPKENRTGQNVALGIAGAFFLVPWFFMNFSEAEKIEINAYRTRYNHLVRIYNDHGCGAMRSEIPSFEQSKSRSRR